jgi:hypothetical protein
MAKEVKHTRSGEIKQRAEDIDQLIKKVWEFLIYRFTDLGLLHDYSAWFRSLGIYVSVPWLGKDWCLCW